MKGVSDLSDPMTMESELKLVKGQWLEANSPNCWNDMNSMCCHSGKSGGGGVLGRHTTLLGPNGFIFMQILALQNNKLAHSPLGKPGSTTVYAILYIVNLCPSHLLGYLRSQFCWFYLRALSVTFAQRRSSLRTILDHLDKAASTISGIVTGPRLEPMT